MIARFGAAAGRGARKRLPGPEQWIYILRTTDRSARSQSAQEFNPMQNLRRIPALAALCAMLFAVAGPSAALAASKTEIDIKVSSSLEQFRKDVTGGAAFLEKAEGVLVFPEVLKAGFGVGGEYGEGALVIGGATADYYSTASASIGFQLGAQVKTIILVFLAKDALEKFRNSAGFEVGVDGSVALIELGVGEDINTRTIQDPIVGFVLSNKGLMYNLTLEGSKITKLSK
jgi:lipid-binding SYLF domain-containing protein